VNYIIQIAAFKRFNISFPLVTRPLNIVLASPTDRGILSVPVFTAGPELLSVAGVNKI